MDLFGEVEGGAGFAGACVACDLDDLEVGVGGIVEAAVEESGEEFELFFSVGEGFGDVAWGELLLVDEDAAAKQAGALYLRRNPECRI